MILYVLDGQRREQCALCTAELEKAHNCSICFALLKAPRPFALSIANSKEMHIDQRATAHLSGSRCMVGISTRLRTAVCRKAC